ncbi:uncharacterized mitochondrial protein AtMg00810-like [Rutidosis leptorrhynchoides]|uniref:uncharacterized mitochondrial protein AtMg00810-like n=1 Tax=Rutidosis leptorrhynchoides TaxID=125765 RepID=UPI003A999708
MTFTTSIDSMCLGCLGMEAEDRGFQVYVYGNVYTCLWGHVYRKLTSVNVLRGLYEKLDVLGYLDVCLDLGNLSSFLGISIQRKSDGLFLNQTAYANDIISRAGMTLCQPISTPVDTMGKLSSNAGDKYKDPTYFRSLAGALQYLTFTRPDIAYAVQQVCLHMHDPRDIHMLAIKRIIRYIKGTVHMGLHMTRSKKHELVSYTDSDWGGCLDTRRSTSGYCVFLGDNLIFWSSKRQPTISRSSAESEYRGVANVVAESYWLRNLLLELHMPLHKATLVLCDN